ncbi:MAG: alpha/beta fold hydrolase [Proteobacteria bacterium]|nr:alpha/beta fold hydrolase [Pseudomonadota bacterium]
MKSPFSSSRSNAAHRFSRRAALASLATLPLAGCIGSSRSFNAHAGTAAIEKEPVLHVITTRRLAAGGAKSPFLDTSRAPQPLYARAMLYPPDRSMLGQISSVVTSDFGVRVLEPQPGLASSGFAEALRGRDTLLFVHGYNQTFEAASRDAAQLSHGIGFRGNAALFSWPSRGGLLDYGYDRESALLARDPLADVLAATLQDEFGARLHIVAHSMGTLVTLEALRLYRERHGDKGADRLGALVFAAPDIDLDVFRAGIGRLGQWKERLTVITATNDRALDISRRLAGGNRVGALSRDMLADTGVRVLDATDFTSGLIRHDAFVANADVRAAIRRTIEQA